MSAHRGRRHGRARAARVAAALAASGALLAATLPVVGSQASWRDDEWVHGAAATLDCAEDNTFATRASGKLLGGSLLDSEPDDAVELEAMTVTNDGTDAHPDPSNATHLHADADGDLDGEDAWANPLSVVALGSVPVTGVGTLADVLAVDADSSVGALNQYARARSNGHSLGASGMVNDSGAVDPGPGASGETPTLGTVKLSALVQALTDDATADLAAGVSDLSLRIGAVAGRAALDACDYEWTGDLAANLERTYVITALDALLETSVGDQLRAPLTESISDFEDLAADIGENGAVTAEIVTGVGDLLDPVLGTLEVGEVSVDDLTVALDLAPVTALGTATISDDAGTVELDLGTGAVSVDLAALMGEAYDGDEYGGPGRGLNQLPPNTELLVNEAVTTALASALAEALGDWVTDVVATLERQLDAAYVSTTITATVTDVLGASEEIVIQVDGTLADLRDGDPDAVDVTASGLLGDVLVALVSPLASELGTLVGDVVGDALDEPADDLAAGPASAVDAVDAVATVLPGVLHDYLGVDGLVSLRANLQNDPLTGTPTYYPEWETGTREVPVDRYDVAALGLSVLEMNGPNDNVTLELGRASVGVNCLLGGAWDLADRCAGY